MNRRRVRRGYIAITPPFSLFIATSSTSSASFPSSAWEHTAAKLRFASGNASGVAPSREAELPDVRTQAELGNEGDCRLYFCSAFFDASYFTHDTCVTSWSRAANEMAALVAHFGLLFAGNVAS